MAPYLASRSVSSFSPPALITPKSFDLVHTNHSPLRQPSLSRPQRIPPTSLNAPTNSPLTQQQAVNSTTPTSTTTYNHDNNRKMTTSRTRRAARAHLQPPPRTLPYLPALLTLPAELRHQILTYLSPSLTLPRCAFRTGAHETAYTLTQTHPILAADAEYLLKHRWRRRGYLLRQPGRPTLMTQAVREQVGPMRAQAKVRRRAVEEKNRERKARWKALRLMERWVVWDRFLCCFFFFFFFLFLRGSAGAD
ncbi:uncharacterized protein K452DRAFT_360698 [Aplosporella prunicola CBS 121167]|uniref:Uncharacterized protein n=1 Tax=Aplosporella prunicola CBS 121167 TaxID=1176127 RepID=A0A6A6B695_9PEZI|nr:uncharacterized protein K452DRAFT_360698 [Aplosporella prunicola CBS 121167]KAF2138933.1 hypothetical protein K452DRAFT_360698 [Aplosporella prunicola CBS 121167]